MLTVNRFLTIGVLTEMHYDVLTILSHFSVASQPSLYSSHSLFCTATAQSGVTA